MALLLVLLLLVLLYVAVSLFHDRQRIGYEVIRNVADSARLQSLARSGVDFGIALLARDARESVVDTLHEPWARAGELVAELAPGEDGQTLDVRITDASGLIAVNALVPFGEQGRTGYDPRLAAVFSRLLAQEEFGLQPGQVRDLVAAVIDWLDGDDEEITEFDGGRGAEGAYYREQHAGGASRNRPVDSLDQLLGVRGLTATLLFGDEDHAGIAPYLSCAAMGDALGRININTAPAMVLRALDERIDRHMAERLVQYRRENPHSLADPHWYRAVAGELRLPDELLSSRSRAFVVEAVAGEAGIESSGRLLLIRGDEGFVFQSWLFE
ncbi:MAG: type II secretion system minor pseudopilin GspK [Thermodesulfobacteriota bacterium]